MQDVKQKANPANWHRTGQHCLLMLIATGCIIGVLLATAHTPDEDEWLRGIASGIAAYLVTAFTGGRIRNFTGGAS